MERRQIEYFTAVADHGSFTAAAHALHVAQPSLSRAIKTLERELGTELFHRLPRGIRLSAAGEALLDSARHALREFEVGRALVHEVAGVRSGRLDIASLPTLALDPLAPVIGRFRTARPGITLRLVQPEERAAVRDSVASGQAELGVADAAGEPDPELATERIGDQDFVAVLPPGSPPPPTGEMPWDELLARDFVTGVPGTVGRDILEEQARRRGASLRLVVEVSHRESALHLVVAGAGCALLPAPLADIAALKGAVTARTSPPLHRELRLLRRAGRLSPAAREFRELLLRGE
ncbi:LysR family transcriptional regulator [Salinifilum aidingensis]